MDLIEFLGVGIFISLISYGLFLQIQHLLTIRKNEKYAKNRRLMLGNYLTCFSIAGFLTSFILNVFVYLQLIHSYIVTSISTNTFCLIFLFAIITSKFLITPRDTKNKLSV